MALNLRRISFSQGGVRNELHPRKNLLRKAGDHSGPMALMVTS